MEYRLWKEDDIEAIGRLERESFSQPRSLDALLSEYKNNIAEYLVAEKDGEILGYGGYYFVLDEGYVTNIAVDSNLRKQGIGRGIVISMLKSAKKRGLSFLSLEARKSNLSAIRLYESLGFLYQGERKGFYEKPREDALIYTRTFKEEEDF